MKKIAVFSLITIASLLSCGSPNSSVKSELQAVPAVDDFPSLESHPVARQETNSGYGPFFLPENSSLDSVSLNYVTDRPEETTVYFSMTKNNDWARCDDRMVTHHKMTFQGVEESACYRFEVPFQGKGVSRLSSFRTMPYDAVYRFDFAVADVNSRWDNLRNPHFVVLCASQPEISGQQFRRSFEENRNIYTSTVIVPAFELTLEENNTVFRHDGLNIVRYRDLNLVIIDREFTQFNSLVRFLASPVEEDLSQYLLCIGLEDNEVRHLKRQYGHLLEGIITYGNSEIEGTLPVRDYRVFSIARDGKERYVLKKSSGTVMEEGW